MAGLVVWAAAGLCVATLAACGGTRTGKLKRLASDYVQAKYGFTAQADEVSVDSVSWLEPTWEKGKSGIVSMSYQGKRFYVQAYLDSGVEGCTDNYQTEEFSKRIEEPLRQGLVFSHFLAQAHYGLQGPGGNYVGIDIRSFDDLVAQGSIEVCVSTCGLDPTSVAGVDLAYLGDNPKVGLFDFKDPAVIEAGYVPVTSIAPADGDWIGLVRHFCYRDGMWAQQGYVQQTCDGVTFAYRYDSDLQVTPIEVDADTEGLVEMTGWYELSSMNNAEHRVMVFPQTQESGQNMYLQLYYPETGQINLSSTKIPSYEDMTDPSPFVQDWPYHSFVYVNLTNKQAQVMQGDIAVRILREG